MAALAILLEDGKHVAIERDGWLAIAGHGSRAYRQARD